MAVFMNPTVGEMRVMSGTFHSHLQERVVQAANAALKRNGSVSPLDLFVEMGWLPLSHLKNWKKGNPHHATLLPSIQAGPAKQQKSLDHFRDWVQQNNLRPLAAEYTRRGPDGIETLRITEDGESARENFFKTHYAPGDLSPKQSARLEKKLKSTPDLVVFEKVSDEGNCSECKVELLPGDFLMLEKGQPLCLICADLDHLVFLPAGNTALSRRSRKNSPLAAVVVRFSRSRNRYERQGLLVTEQALAEAEEQCAADAPDRALAREGAARKRLIEDVEFVSELEQAILTRYPKCPATEARQIAEHTGRRNSGRVGRSQAGRALEPQALDFAVIAHIRHVHTNYDELLMSGADRSAARALVREQINLLLASWSAA
jgi:hypothetical protein